MSKLLLIICIFCSLNAFANNKASIIGIWAMIPLNNGIANVVEYREDGTSILHPFNCAKPDEQRQ